jgi:hypothetical protein
VNVDLHGDIELKMIADVLVVFAACLGVLGLLDLLLDDRQKKRLDERLLQLWNYFDEANTISKRLRLFSVRTAVVLVVISFILVVLFLISEDAVGLVLFGEDSDLAYFFPFVVVVLFVYIFVGFEIVAYAAKAVIAVLEFLLRRINEYPKGSLLGLSGFLGGIAAIIKVLQ